MGRESSRSRRLVIGMSASAISRGLAALAPLITVPVSLQFLGVSGYGAWSAALALTAFTAFADLGIGAGLMTKLSAALATDNLGLAKRLVSSAYVAVVSLIAALLGLLWVSQSFVDWATVVGGDGSRDDGDVSAIALITISAFLINAAAMLIVRVQYAAQQVPASNVWQAAGSLAGIAAIYIAAGVSEDKSEFVAVAAFTPAAIAIINTVYFFAFGPGRTWRPEFHGFHWTETRELAKIGSKFLIISVLMAASLSTDSWIIAHAVSLEAVTEFSIPARVFAVIGTAVSVLSIPLWPANAEALSNGDLDWVRRTTHRMTVIAPVVVAILAIVGVLIAPTALDWWLGGSVQPSLVLLSGLGAWSLVQAVVAPMFMVQNAVGVLRPQIVGYTALLAAIPLKWFVAGHWGYEWLPFTAVACYVAIIWPTAWFGYRRSMKLAAVSTIGRANPV